MPARNTDDKLTGGMGFISPHSDHVRKGALREFAETWETYPSPSAAILQIAQAWEVGRTTMTGWVKDEGLWPTATISQLRKLKAENTRLREQVTLLRAKLVNEEC